MKTTPMLFSGEMVLALLRGQKTQTRRIIKNPEYYGCLTGDCPHYVNKLCAEALAVQGPYRVGNLLWVRESWGYHGYMVKGGEDNGQCSITYKADNSKANIAIPHSKFMEWTPAQHNVPYSDPLAMEEYFNKWYKRQANLPSIFMRKWASRLTLEITSIKVENLLDISDKDTFAEGFAHPDLFHDYWRETYPFEESYQGENNPALWVIEFKTHFCNFNNFVKS